MQSSITDRPYCIYPFYYSWVCGLFQFGAILHKIAIIIVAHIMPSMHYS